MNISRKPRSTRRHIGQAIISSVAVAAISGIFSLASFGLPDSVAAQPAPTDQPPAPTAPPAPPGPPAGTGATPINFGQTVQGQLTTTDPVTRTGRPRDHLRLVSTTPNASFFISVTSPTMALRTGISYRNVALRGDPLEALQEARTFEPGQTLLFGGTLEKRGEYQIEVTPAEAVPLTGSYTVTLSNNPPPSGTTGGGAAQ